MEQVDAVIVGSGYGGSITAARLAAAGMKVVVLERGLRKGPSDFQQTGSPKYIETVVDVVVSSSQVAFRTGKLVGGASIPMDGGHFRAPQKTFSTLDDSGRPYWPSVYSRASLDPYYATAEQMLTVRQFQWSEISKPGGMFAKMLAGAGATCDRARLNYADCLGCGFCAEGCIFDKKRNLLHNYIPLAELNGAEFRAESMADHVEPSGTGYVVSYFLQGQPAQIYGQRVIIAAGGIHSPAVLLRSAKYLTGLSPQVGENFNNNGEHSLIGILPPEFDDLSSYYCYKGSDNAAVMCYEWFESDGFTLHPGGGLSPSIFAAHLARSNDPVFPSQHWGLEYKRFVESVFPHRLIAFSSLGLAPSHRAVSLKPDGTPDVLERDPTAYYAYLDRLESIMFGVGQKTGVSLIADVPRAMAGTTSAHLLSACRMAETPADGVVDPDCQVFGYPNLYVCDASSMPFAIGVNPALTISAVSERAAQQIILKG